MVGLVVPCSCSPSCRTQKWPTQPGRVVVPSIEGYPEGFGAGFHETLGGYMVEQRKKLVVCCFVEGYEGLLSLVQEECLLAIFWDSLRRSRLGDFVRRAYRIQRFRCTIQQVDTSSCFLLTIAQTGSKLS
jgi:hypothetical protein